MPSLSISVTQKQNFFAANLAGREDITSDTLSDGTVDSWAVSLNDTDATSIKGLMQGFGYFIPEVFGVDDGDGIGNNNSQAEPARRSLSTKVKATTEIFIPPTLDSRDVSSPWESEQRTWDTAIVSQPKGHQVSFWNYDYSYTYVRENAVQPGKGVRVYIFDSGLDLTHPEFASRARVRGSTNPEDYNVQWIFADHDPMEALYDRRGRRLSYQTTWQDPNDPNGPRNPKTGFLEAYTDYKGHGTKVASVLFGDTLGIAQAADVTIVKLVSYTSGPLVGKITLYSLRSALRKTREDIRSRRSNTETKFAINLSVGTLSRDYPSAFIVGYSAMWAEFLQELEALDVSVIGASGNYAVVGVPVRIPYTRVQNPTY